LADRFLDMPDRLFARQDTGYREEAGLKNGIRAYAETDVARHGGRVDNKEAQLLVDDLLLHGPWQFVPGLILPIGAVEKEDAAHSGDPQQVLPFQKPELMTGNETGRGNQIGRLDRIWPKAQM